MYTMAHSSFTKGPFDEKGGQWPPLDWTLHYVVCSILALVAKCILLLGWAFSVEAIMSNYVEHLGPQKKLIVSQAFPHLFQMPLICLFFRIE